MNDEQLEELEEIEDIDEAGQEENESISDNQENSIDYSSYLDDIISNQESILVELQTVNSNLENSNANSFNGFSVTSALLIMVFLIILLIAACKYFKRLFKSERGAIWVFSTDYFLQAKAQAMQLLLLIGLLLTFLE